MTDSYSPTYWVDSSTPAINAANLRKIEKGVADAHGIVDATLGSTGEVDRSVVKDGAGHYLKLPALTTAERDALTPATGMLIYNSTLGCLQAYRGSAWVDVHAGTIRDNLSLNSKRITDLADPTSNQDAATKAYVDVRPGYAGYLTKNAYLDGGVWYRTDEGAPAWLVDLGVTADVVSIYRAPAGTGAISWTQVLRVSPAGVVTQAVKLVPSSTIGLTVVGETAQTFTPTVGAGSKINLICTLSYVGLGPDAGGLTRTLEVKINGVTVATHSQPSTWSGFGWQYDPVDVTMLTDQAIAAGDTFWVGWTAGSGGIVSKFGFTPTPIVEIF